MDKEEVFIYCLIGAYKGSAYVQLPPLPVHIPKPLFHFFPVHYCQMHCFQLISYLSPTLRKCINT